MAVLPWSYCTTDPVIINRKHKVTCWNHRIYDNIFKYYLVKIEEKNWQKLLICSSLLLKHKFLIGYQVYNKSWCQSFLLNLFIKLFVFFFSVHINFVIYLGNWNNLVKLNQCSGDDNTAITSLCSSYMNIWKVIIRRCYTTHVWLLIGWCAT